ncbi:unnamed protein product [Bursaphelenchus okinawaensis]|uniref:INO80 complex subunit E N-terminal domain-containing protein n=1 Tax=Bursaphelenchus okinawaensis TaxID=465554 RepID=A0A811JSM3_9BILA|nr:unnamed protein product [Bursaphelenchus okinawaensis]CAG9081360.1 unnamed protein product [Bursaphelenchus okinawaensis]
MSEDKRPCPDIGSPSSSTIPLVNPLSSAATTENGHFNNTPASADNKSSKDINSTSQRPLTMYAPKCFVKLPDRDQRNDIRASKDNITDYRPKENLQSSYSHGYEVGQKTNVSSQQQLKPSSNGDKPLGDNEFAGTNGKSSKNGNASMPPPKIKPSPKKPSSSQQERPVNKGSNPSPKRPLTNTTATYQKARFPSPSNSSSSHNNYGHHVQQYGPPSGYVVRSSPSNNQMYTVQQRGPPAVRAQPPGSTKPQVIIQPQGNVSTSQQHHFIIQTPQDQYPHRAGATVQRAYPSANSGPPVSVAGQQHQQQVVIQFHHPPLNDNQRVLIHQHQPVERRVMTSAPYPTSASQPHSSQQSSSQMPEGVSERDLIHSRQMKPMPPKIPQPVKPDDIYNEMSSHPDLMALPDSFNTILDQIHSSGAAPKDLYKILKRQFKFLVYENECYQEELRSSQRKLLKLSRDKNFLLDRLLAHEIVDSDDQVNPGEESDADSEATIDIKPKPKKKKSSKKRPNPSSEAGPATKKLKDNGDFASDDGDSKPPSRAQNSRMSPASVRTDFSSMKPEHGADEQQFPSGSSTPLTQTPVKSSSNVQPVDSQH